MPVACHSYNVVQAGKQETLDDIKAQKYQQLKRSDLEYEEWFLKYSPVVCEFCMILYHAVLTFDLQNVVMSWLLHEMLHLM